MHHSIRTEDMKAEREKLNHKVTNIWNTKHHKTKLTLPMFFVKLKPAPTTKTYSMLNIYNSAKLNLNHLDKKRYRTMCKMSKIWTQKISIIKNQDA
jgi:hypothetical protein